MKYWKNVKNGAGDVIWLQPLTEIIIRELENFPIDEMHMLYISY